MSERDVRNLLSGWQICRDALALVSLLGSVFDDFSLRVDVLASILLLLLLLFLINFLFSLPLLLRATLALFTYIAPRLFSVPFLTRLLFNLILPSPLSSSTFCFQTFGVFGLKDMAK